jgi:anaerobic selenocysteine-containing dehydrogenase
VFQMLRRLTAGQPCDITGIADYQMLDQLGGVQWPCNTEDAARLLHAKDPMPNAPFAANERRLFTDGQYFHPDGLAKFIFERPQPLSEPADSEYPFTLLTGRGTASQWHTQTRTGKSAILRKLYPPDAWLEMNQHDADSLGIPDGHMAEVSSRRGIIHLRVVVTSSVQRGQVFAPMHYENVNRLTQPSFDPYSRQPSYKACAVKVKATGTHEPHRNRAEKDARKENDGGHL